MALPQQIKTSNTPKKEFPYLTYLMDGWLNEDYTLMGGPTFKGVILDYISETSKPERSGTIDDIYRFLGRFGSEDSELIAAMNRIFYPCFVI